MAVDTALASEADGTAFEYRTATGRSTDRTCVKKKLINRAAAGMAHDVPSTTMLLIPTENNLSEICAWLPGGYVDVPIITPHSQPLQ